MNYTNEDKQKFIEKIKNLALDCVNGKTFAQKLTKDHVLASTDKALVLKTIRLGKQPINEVLILKVDGKMLGNSSTLRELEFLTGFRNAIVQDFISQHIPMIPFVVMAQAGLNLNEFKELDRGQAETIFRKEHLSKRLYNEAEKIQFIIDNLLKENCQIIKHNYSPCSGLLLVDDGILEIDYLQPRHFTGARLFQVGTKVFLMDVDRGELQHGIINPFLVELTDTKVKTIQQAYDSLKPLEVKKAEDRGLETKRQGEWFFIPVNMSFLETVIQKRGALQVKNNRPNWVDEYVKQGEDVFVKGTVSHAGREHKDLVLDQWFKAVPNTSVNSWQITGDID